MATIRHSSAILLLATIFTGNAAAALLTFTDQAMFLAALPGSANTLDFDSYDAGTTGIASGSTIDGIRFDYDFGGVQLQVTDGNRFGGGGSFNTTSGSNFLGTDDADLLLDGDDVSLGFAPMNAIGMFFITADTMFDDDILLSAAGTSVGLSLAAAGADLGDGGMPFFLGIIDTENTFISAEITTIGGGFFAYNIDDITTSVVPLPAGLWLFISGLALVASMRKRLS